jgi:pantothenate kinase type III
MDLRSIVAIDIGNSRSKVARVFNNRVEKMQDLETLSVAGCASQLSLSDRVFVVSVVQEATRKLCDALSGVGLRFVHVIGRDGQLNVASDYATPQTLGQDRILAAYEAYHSTGKACVVVDAGSAITVD